MLTFDTGTLMPVSADAIVIMESGYLRPPQPGLQILTSVKFNFLSFFC